MNFRELIYSKQFFGSGGSGKLEEITITENGVYKPLKEVVIGGTYKFKDRYTREDLEAITGGSTWFGLISDYENDVGLYIISYNSGYRLHYYAQGTYSWGYCYVTEEATDSTYQASGWYSAMGNAGSVPTPTITMPDTTSGYQVELSVMKPLFDMTQADGFSKVTVDVTGGSAVLKELAITENGVYEAHTEVEPGGTYRFRDSYTNVELKEFYDNELYCEVAEAEIIVREWWTDSNKCYYVVQYDDYILNKSYSYLSKEILIDSEFLKPNTEPGWYLYRYNQEREWVEKVEAPTINIPSNPEDIFSDLSVIAPVFELADGYNKITVNVEAGLEEITIVKNGAYEAVSDIELGGTYKFKDSYTDAELGKLFNAGQINGWHSYLINAPSEQSFSIARETYNGEVRYGIYTYDAVYVGEQASKHYTNGVPGWYAYSASEPCSAPRITLPTNSQDIVSLDLLESVFVLSNGYNKVVVNVQSVAEPVLEELVVTDNGEYVPDGIDGYNKVVVEVEKGVFPEGELEITDNGIHDVTNYASVSVDIEKGIFPDGELEITRNGVHDVTNYASVSVDVPVEGGKLASVVDGSVTKITAEDLAGATKILEYKFRGCTNLTSVVIPDSVTSIDSHAFYECTGLINVTIPNTIVTIPRYIFSGCSSLTNITIPDSVTTIDTNSFNGCASLPSISIPDSVTTIGSSAFMNCENLASVTIGNGVTKIDNYAFGGCHGLTSMVIPGNVTNIGSYVFQRCSNLESATLCEGVTGIGGYMFAECGKLTNVTIPNTVTSIGTYAFFVCTSLTSVTIPDSVKSIGSYAFKSCIGLTSAIIGNGVTKIDVQAFSGDTKLEYIDLTSYGAGKTFPTLANTNVFTNCGTSTTSGTFEIRVLAGRKDELAGMSNWSTYADNIVEV